jgi:hypothetical protein
MGVIHVSTMFGAKAREPLVDIVDEEKEYRIQLRVGEARALGLNILQAAEAAVSDGFLFQFFKEKLDTTDNQSAHMMNDFRKYRSKTSSWPRVVTTE